MFLAQSTPRIYIRAERNTERERERDTHTETDRDRERQRETETGRQTDRHIHTDRLSPCYPRRQSC